MFQKLQVTGVKNFAYETSKPTVERFTKAKTYSQETIEGELQMNNFLATKLL